MKVLQPYVKIRIGLLTNYTRIGHLAGNSELFLRKFARGDYKQDIRFIFLSGKPANRQLLTMIKRHVTVIENGHALNVFNAFIRRTNVNIYLPHKANEYDEFNNVPPQLSFNESEEAKGQYVLAEMGLGPDDKFICFHTRDTAYLDATDSSNYQRKGGYHDYRDCGTSNYMLSAEYLANSGYAALRMGQVVEESLPVKRHRKIIDYTWDYRSDFADIYLIARCSFLLGNTSGLWVVATCFNTPIAIANVIPLVFVPKRPDGLFIPKKLWDTQRKKFLSFREILECGADEWIKSDKYTEAGIEAIENTPEEILALSMEMHARLEGKWEATEEEEELQARYHALFSPEHRCYGFPSRIGTDFLMQNRELLD